MHMSESRVALADICPGTGLPGQTARKGALRRSPSIRRKVLRPGFPAAMIGIRRIVRWPFNVCGGRGCGARPWFVNANLTNGR